MATKTQAKRRKKGRKIKDHRFLLETISYPHQKQMALVLSGKKKEEHPPKNNNTFIT